MIEITTPATTANIGPGYDTLGISLKLYNKVVFTNGSIGFEITGCEKKFQNVDNLIYRSFRETEKILGLKNKNIKIDINSKIPVSRGLGSSAACVVSGVMGAFGIHKIKIEKEEILKISTKIEGHPDNIAPCIYGGLTASFVDEGQIYTDKYEVDSDLCFYALIPDFELSTSKSREVLPEKISHNDAVFNLSRLPILINALRTGDMLNLKAAIKDKLHQPYREKLIHEIGDVRKIIYKQKESVYYLSGAGPTIMCISKNKEMKKILSEELKSLKREWIIKKLTVDNKGVKYRRIK
jgi:homoserine kinase